MTPGLFAFWRIPPITPADRMAAYIHQTTLRSRNTTTRWPIGRDRQLEAVHDFYTTAPMLTAPVTAVRRTLHARGLRTRVIRYAPFGWLTPRPWLEVIRP